jgi:hypothetical protein
MIKEKSPFADCDAVLHEEMTSISFRGEEYPCVHQYFRCEKTGIDYTSDDTDNAGILPVFNAYRARHRIPFPDEIKALREHYGVSAAKMSEIAGFGINQWKHYESGEVPSVANSRVIIAMRHVETFLSLLDLARERIGDKAYAAIRERVRSLPSFSAPRQPTELTGYVRRSDVRLREAVRFLASTGPVSVSRMNRLLFYCDFLRYRRMGEGLTGLAYRAAPSGPVPDGFGAVYDSLESVSLDDDGEGGATVSITDRFETEQNVFTDSDWEILNEVRGFFKDMNDSEISERSRKEEPWRKCRDGNGLIPYGLAFSIPLSL